MGAGRLPRGCGRTNRRLSAVRVLHAPRSPLLPGSQMGVERGCGHPAPGRDGPPRFPPGRGDRPHGCACSHRCPRRGEGPSGRPERARPERPGSAPASPPPRRARRGRGRGGDGRGGDGRGGDGRGRRTRHRAAACRGPPPCDRPVRRPAATRIVPGAAPDRGGDQVTTGFLPDGRTSEDAVRSPSSGADPRTRLPRPRKPSVTDRPSCPSCLRSPWCHPWSGIGSGRFPIAAAITSGNRSGVQANAGVPSAASAAACSLS